MMNLSVEIIITQGVLDTKGTGVQLQGVEHLVHNSSYTVTLGLPGYSALYLPGFG
jgi:hypothetical protein